MQDTKTDTVRDVKTDQHPPREFFREASHEKFPEPEPILDASCDFEKLDRGEGMGVDDIKEYHRTER